MIFNIEKVVEEKILDRHQIHKKSKMFVTNTIDKSFGGGVSVLGTGINAAQQATVSQPQTIVLPTIISAIDKWIDFVRDKTIFKSIIVPIDNFDMVSEKNIVDFLNLMRDTLTNRKHIWWIIIGQIGLSSLIENSPRLRGMITGNPITLEPMSLKQINEMISLRYKNLEKSAKVETIVPKKIIDILYNVSKGETRYILKRATDMVLSHIADYPSENNVPLKIADKFLSDEAEKRINAAKLTKRKSEILENMVKVSPFQSKDFAKFDLASPQALMKYVDMFMPIDFLVKRETTGKSVYYETTGDVNIYFSNIL